MQKREPGSMLSKFCDSGDTLTVSLVPLARSICMVIAWRLTDATITTASVVADARTVGASSPAASAGKLAAAARIAAAVRPAIIGRGLHIGASILAAQGSSDL